MKWRSKVAAGALILAAGAIVFSPLLATLFGTGLRVQGLTSAFHGVVKPLEGSVITALISALIALVLGLPFALLTEQARRRLRPIFWTLAVLALMVPPYIAAEGWIVLLGPAGKISRPVAMWLGFGPHTTDAVEVARYVVPGFVFTRTGVGLVMGGCFFPIVALAVASALRRTDRRIFEYARMAQGTRGVRKVGAGILLLPAAGAALLVFAATLTEFAVPQVLRVRTMGEAVYERIQEGDLASAAALSLPLLPIVLFAGALGAWFLLRARTASLAGLEGEIPRYEARPSGVGVDLSAGLITFFVLIPGLILPVTSVIWLAAKAELPTASEIGAHKVLRASGFLNSLSGAWGLAESDAIRTVLLATLAATVATLFAIMLARLAARNGQGATLGVLGAGLAVPAPIIGLGLIIVWDHDWTRMFYQNLTIVLLAWFARFLPLVIFLVQGALARVPRELESAAALAGRGWWERFRSVIIPNAVPGLAAAWLAMYVLSATEFSATLLVAPPGSPLLAPSVVNLMRRGQDPEIAACQFLLLAVVGLPLAVIACSRFVRLRPWAGRKEAA